MVEEEELVQSSSCPTARGSKGSAPLINKLSICSASSTKGPLQAQRKLLTAYETVCRGLAALACICCSLLTRAGLVDLRGSSTSSTPAPSYRYIFSLPFLTEEGSVSGSYSIL